MSQLPALIATRKEFVDWQGSLNRREQWHAYLENFSKKDAAQELIKLFKLGIRKSHYDMYVQAWTKLKALDELRPLTDRTVDLGAGWRGRLRHG